MNEILERHWRKMRQMRVAAIREKRRFKAPIYLAVVSELHRVARQRLNSKVPNWRRMRGDTLAIKLNDLGLLSYAGKPFDDDSARRLRMALIEQDRTRAIRSIEEVHDPLQDDLTDEAC